MATEWFYTRDGKKTGPLSSSGLKALADSGKLLPTDLIWKEGMAKPRPAGEIPKLFTQPLPQAQPQTTTTSPSPATAGGTLVEKAHSAARAAGVVAERTKLVTLSLPSAYAALGRYCFDKRIGEKTFPTDFAALQELARTLASVPDNAGVKPEGWKAMASNLVQRGVTAAQQQAIQVRQLQGFTSLGKMISGSQHASECPPDLIAGVRSLLDRIADLDTRMPTVAGRGASAKTITKRWAVGLAAAGIVLCAGYVIVPSLMGRSGRSTTAKDASRPDVSIPDLGDIGKSVAQANSSQRSTTSATTKKQKATPTTEAPVTPVGVPRSSNDQEEKAPEFEAAFTRKWKTRVPGGDKNSCKVGFAAAFSKDGKTVAVGLRGGKVLLCDASTGTVRGVTESPGTRDEFDDSNEVLAIAFSPSGRRVGWITSRYYCAIAGTADGKLVWQSGEAQKDSKPAQTSWGSPSSKWADWGRPDILMTDDDTVLLASGAGVVECSTKGKRVVLNGCMQMTSSRLSKEDIRSSKPVTPGTKPQGAWFDDNVRESLESQPNAKQPDPRLFPDWYRRNLVSFSPDGRFCGAVFVRHAPVLGTDGGMNEGEAATLAVYELSGKCVLTTPVMAAGDARAVGADWGILQDQSTLLLSHIGHVRRIRKDMPPKLLFMGPGCCPTYFALHPKLPVALAIYNDGKARVHFLDHPEVNRGEGILATESFGAYESFGAMSPNGSQLLVGVEHDVHLLDVQVKRP